MWFLNHPLSWKRVITHYLFLYQSLRLLLQHISQRFICLIDCIHIRSDSLVLLSFLPIFIIKLLLHLGIQFNIFKLL